MSVSLDGKECSEIECENAATSYERDSASGAVPPSRGMLIYYYCDDHAPDSAQTSQTEGDDDSR